MRVLFIGGTGIISTACAQLAMSRGFELTVLNRGQRNSLPGLHQITADINDARAVAAAIGDQRWDAVVDFICYGPAEIEHFHQFSQRLSETPGALSHHRVHTAGKSVLGILAEQNCV